MKCAVRISIASVKKTIGSVDWDMSLNCLAEKNVIKFFCLSVDWTVLLKLTTDPIPSDTRRFSSHTECVNRYITEHLSYKRFDILIREMSGTLLAMNIINRTKNEQHFWRGSLLKKFCFDLFEKNILILMFTLLVIEIDFLDEQGDYPMA